MGVAVSASGIQFVNAFAGGCAITLSASLVVGFPTFIAAYSNIANAHVWPAGWTVLFASACDGGYFSVARRVKVAGDPTVVTITNGGAVATWGSSYAGFMSSGAASSIGIVTSSGFVTASGTPVAIPALTDTPDEWLLLVCSSNALSLFASGAYPMSVIVGNNNTEPPILQWPRRASGGSPAFTLTRGAAATTGVYAALLSDGGAAISSAAVYDDFVSERVIQKGFNGYAPVQEAIGGSISVT